MFSGDVGRTVLRPLLDHAFLQRNSVRLSSQTPLSEGSKIRNETLVVLSSSFSFAGLLSLSSTLLSPLRTSCRNMSKLWKKSRRM